MSIARGALIVFEGCDRAGKSTQVKMLIEALNKQNIPAEARAFPERKTPIGSIINDFLAKKKDLSLEAMHLLFCANRWECKEDILKTLHSGTTLIVDRYAGSGAAYTAATTGKNLAWCKEPDKGLPCPDMVILLKISETSQRLRSNWGEERFETSKLQRLVASNYEKLQEKTWSIIDADQEQSVIHSQILEKVLVTVQTVQNSTIGCLYDTNT
ncbi:PREDICTED: thymidylate kinase [Dufourea novaeangliae]|uniref:Thymidylate kinase n=1 Tax=Dufourea novaeangliae TaxID=178035 RepID=A0A154PN71_DUFNO|nr:PREDICTED: thymidylate kinase [Dufourea novaeangliae]KZC13293.1 Thymidylate kinase [Dufourea novaeangliae]